MDIFYSDNRGLTVLNILEENYQTNEKYLMEKLKVSSKTIQNEVKELNKRLKNIAYIKIENGDYRLYIIKLESYLSIKNEIYEVYKNFDSSKVRMMYAFKKLIESKDMIRLDDLAEEMMISRSTLNSDIKKLKEVISDYNLKISGKTNSGIFLEGREKDIRFFVLENVYNYIYKEDIFTNSDEKIIDELLEKYGIDLHVKNEFLRYLTLSIDRYANDNFLEFGEEYSELLGYYSDDFLDELISYIKNEYKINLSEDEKKFLTICFATMRIPSNISRLKDKIRYTDEYTSLVKESLLKIYDKFGIDIDLSSIKEEFIYHIYFLMMRMRYGIRYKNNMKEMVREKYPMSYKMAVVASEVIGKKYGYTISEDEVCYLAIYFETFKSKLNIKDVWNILLITNAAPAYKALMIQDLEKSLGTNINIVTKTEYEVDEELEGYDLVISTVKKDFSKGVNVIYQGEILDTEYIKKEITFMNYIGKIEAPAIRGMESLLLSSIDEDCFFICKADKTYRENLVNAIEKLKKRGIVDEGFLGRIEEREKKGSTFFTNNISFPHTVNYASDGIKIILMVAKNGVVDYPDLRLIFLGALPKDGGDSAALVRTYDELISIIRSDTVDDISKVGSYEELLEFFIKNTNLYR